MSHLFGFSLLRQDDLEEELRELEELTAHLARQGGVDLWINSHLSRFVCFFFQPTILVDWLEETFFFLEGGRGHVSSII